MKKLLIILLPFFINISFSQNNSGTTYCFGYIDGTKLIAELPELKAANEKIQALEIALTSENEKMVSDLREKLDKYSKEAQSKSQTENDLRAKEVENIKSNITNRQQEMELELKNKRTELITPLIDKINSIIQRVARSKNITSVLDTSQLSNQVLIFNENNNFLTNGYNLMDEVKKELGIN